MISTILFNFWPLVSTEWWKQCHRSVDYNIISLIFMVIILVMQSKKVVMESQIIGIYPYMIPHFNTNKLLQAFLLYIWYCDYSACIYSNFKGSKVKSIFVDLWPLTSFNNCLSKHGKQNNMFMVKTCSIIHQLWNEVLYEGLH